MPKRHNIRFYLRHLLLSFTLLWALALNGQEVIAYGAPATEAATKTARLLAASNPDNRTEVKQKISLEATTSFVALNLQQATVPVPVQTFATPSDEAIPAFAVTPPGAGFVALLFPVIIQPQAP